MMMHDLGGIARALGGRVIGSSRVLAPGPGHSRRDRSLSVWFSATAPDGFIVCSHAGDDWTKCKDYVRARLGIEREDASSRPTEARRRAPEPRREDDGRKKKMADAMALWNAAIDPRGTLVEKYLNSRRLDLGDDLASDVLRWDPRFQAMIALFRDISTNEPQAVSRTYLDREGRKIERKFLGPVGGAAIKLDPDDAVTHGLHLGEGTETAMAARRLGLRPTWALGSAGAVAAFPVLNGVECLTLLAEHDDASTRAVEACAGRWHTAGRPVLIVKPTFGKDINDAVRGKS
jgi:hypothetical protein